MLRVGRPSARRRVLLALAITAPPLGRAEGSPTSHIAKYGGFYGERHFADRKQPPPRSRASPVSSSDSAILPGSQSSAAPRKVPPPPGAVNLAPESAPTPATPSSPRSISDASIPLVPPAPSGASTTPPMAKPSSGQSPQSVPFSPSPPASSRPGRRLPRYLIYLVLVGGLSYGLAVFYALKSDNFHDFFTEYVPFGEESVLYFEERSFHKRFPNARINQDRVPVSAQTDGSKITIPSKSGMSWRVSDEVNNGSKATQKRRHMSALDTSLSKKENDRNPEQNSPVADRHDKSSKSNSSTKDQSLLRAVSHSPAPAARPADANLEAESPASIIAPVSKLSPVEVDDAAEPLARELAKIFNDLITVINADSMEASSKYSAPIEKAKESLAGLGAKLEALKTLEKQAAQEKFEELRSEYNEGAKELTRRIDAARSEELAQFREEFESEREKLSRSYDDKLSIEVERARNVFDQQNRNELAEQAIKLKRKCVADVQLLVEDERDGRLSQISKLTTKVDDLERLTSDWNGVIDSNLATQKLQVAVDAVQSSIASAAMNHGQCKPFVSELAALKEVANGDPVVDAAISSMNPTAYQRGIPSSAQLLDRFRRVSSEVRKASLLPENAGVGSHVASALLSRVMFKKQGQPEGGDVESVLTRSETLLEEGDLDGAAREVNTLQGWAGVLSRDWLHECRRVLEVKQALEVIEAEARLQCLQIE